MKLAAVVLLLAFASVASARDFPIRSLLSEEKQTYCSGTKYDDQCPEYYQCVELDHKFCEKTDCKKNAYGEEKCDQECHTHVCLPKPRYCEPPKGYAAKDPCAEEYGKEWECQELDKKICDCGDADCKKDYAKCDCKQVQRCKNDYADCKLVNLSECRKYKLEAQCKKDTKCLKHGYSKKDCLLEVSVLKDCKIEKVCDEYFQKQVCKSCKDYKYVQECTPKPDCYTGICVKKPTKYDSIHG